MEQSYTPDGKLIVTFNGAPQVNCFHDTDCIPANAQCYLNQTWAAFPAMCACPSAFMGPDCLQRSPQGYARLAFECMALILGLPALLVGIWDMVRMVRLRMNVKKHFGGLNVVEATSIFSTLAVAFVMLMVTYYIIWFSEGRTSVEEVQGRFIRMSRISDMMVVSVLAFFFVTISCLNITLLWLSIAKDASRIRMNNNNLILRYKYLLALYYLLFGLVIIILAIINRYDQAFYVAIPAILVVIITCLYGWYKLKFELEGFGSESHSVLRKVEFTAACLGTSCLAALIFAAFTTQVDRPDSKFTSVASGLFWFSVMLTQLSVMSFTHPSIVRRENKTKSTLATHSKTSSKEGHANLNAFMNSNNKLTHAVEPESTASNPGSRTGL